MFVNVQQATGRPVIEDGIIYFRKGRYSVIIMARFITSILFFKKNNENKGHVYWTYIKGLHFILLCSFVKKDA